MRKPYLLPLVAALFALITRLAVAETQSTPKPGPDTGLEGVILVGPIQGGPSKQGVPDSKPLANTEFVVEKGNGTVATFMTDEQGRFRISLQPGHYTVSKKGLRASIGSYGPFEVDVVAGQVKKVEWNCDTGMR
jgi:prealbumin domain-containing protein